VAGLPAWPVAALEAPLVSITLAMVPIPTTPTMPSVASHFDRNFTVNLPARRYLLSAA
jgi:hypothetical protein